MKLVVCLGILGLLCSCKPHTQMERVVLKCKIHSNTLQEMDCYNDKQIAKFILVNND